MGRNILYLECESGISGDMTVAALLDLGAERQVLLNALESLPLSGYSIEIKDVYKSGIRACDFNVILDEEHENHDHDMAYLYGPDHDHGDLSLHDYEHTDFVHTEHIHENSHHHSHALEDSEHVHENPHYLGHDRNDSDPPDCILDGSHHHSHDDAHGHTSRNLKDIVEIIRAGCLSENAAELAIQIFEILAKAEAYVHGKRIDEVHFHEVGAVDSIVDIVAAAVCLDNLHPDGVVVSALTEGCGLIRCQHGLIPVPVPAVSAIATQKGLILKLTDIQGELVTPTGAAIAAAVHSEEKLPEQFRIRKVGIGAGKRDYATAGILRAMWIEDAANAKHSEVKSFAETMHMDNIEATGSADPMERNDVFKSDARTASSKEEIAPECEDQVFKERDSKEQNSKELVSRELMSRKLMSNEQNTKELVSYEQNSKEPVPRELDFKEQDAKEPVPKDLDSIFVLETNIDDCTGEALAFTMQQLLSAGALDVFYIPIYMKKNRPACLLKTICKQSDRERLEAIIFQNTTTIGIRRQEMQRTKLSREMLQLQTPWGTADIKCCAFENTLRYFPENDSVSRLAAENKIGFPEMYRLLQGYACEHAVPSDPFRL